MSRMCFLVQLLCIVDVLAATTSVPVKSVGCSEDQIGTVTAFASQNLGKSVFMIDKLFSQKVCNFHHE